MGKKAVFSPANEDCGKADTIEISGNKVANNSSKSTASGISPKMLEGVRLAAFDMTRNVSSSRFAAVLDRIGSSDTASATSILADT
ncbi:hypothetical protein IAU59_004991 [Kwoniella sp. CBS 9459]